jgi:hypothetical protein
MNEAVLETVKTEAPSLAPLSLAAFEKVRAFMGVRMEAPQYLTVRWREGRLFLFRWNFHGFAQLSFPFPGEAPWEAGLDPEAFGGLVERLPAPPALGFEGKDLVLQLGRFRARLYGEEPYTEEKLPSFSAQVLTSELKRALAAVPPHGGKPSNLNLVFVPYRNGFAVAATSGYTLGAYLFPEAGALPLSVLGSARVRFLSAFLEVAPQVVRLGSDDGVFALSGTQGPFAFAAGTWLSKGPGGYQADPGYTPQAVNRYLVEAKRPYRAVVKARDLAKAVKGKEDSLLSLRAASGVLEVVPAKGGAGGRVPAIFPKAWEGQVKAWGKNLALALKGFSERVTLALDEERKTLALFSAEEREERGLVTVVGLVEKET